MGNGPLDTAFTWRRRPLNRRFPRRALLAGIAALPVVAGGCGADPSASQPVAVATPGGPVPGFDDPTRWSGRTVVAATWGGEVETALRAAIFAPFERATGAVVDQAPVEYARLASPAATGSAYADLVLVDAFYAVSRAAEAALEPLAADAAGAALDGRFGADGLTVPAFAYAIVPAFRREVASEQQPVDGWASWWDAARFPGDRSLGVAPFGTLEAALLADGVEAAALYPLDLERALARLRGIAASIGDRWWSAGYEPVTWLGTGRADFASAWHYRVIAGQWDGLDVDWTWDQGLMVADRWGIARGAASPDVADDLIRYASSPTVQAALAREVPLGPTNPEAFAFIDPFLAATLPTTPDHVDRLIVSEAGWWATNRAEAEQRLAEILPEPSAPGG